MVYISECVETLRVTIILQSWASNCSFVIEGCVVLSWWHIVCDLSWYLIGGYAIYPDNFGRGICDLFWYYKRQIFDLSIRRYVIYLGDMVMWICDISQFSSRAYDLVWYTSGWYLIFHKKLV